MLCHEVGLQHFYDFWAINCNIKTISLGLCKTCSKSSYYLLVLSFSTILFVLDFVFYQIIFLKLKISKISTEWPQRARESSLWWLSLLWAYCPTWLGWDGAHWALGLNYLSLNVKNKLFSIGEYYCILFEKSVRQWVHIIA